MRRGGLTACLLAAGAALAADNTPENQPVIHENEQRWGSPRIVVSPDYPSGALAAGQTGHVDVEGVILSDGVMAAHLFVPDSPASQVFVPAIKEVLHFWRFYPEKGPDCLPVEHEARVRIWFEIEAGKPKISVTRPKRSKAPSTQWAMPLKRVDPQYPSEMQRRGYEATVYARLEVRNGRVENVTATAYPKAIEGPASALRARNHVGTQPLGISREPESKLDLVLRGLLPVTRLDVARALVQRDRGE